MSKPVSAVENQAGDGVVAGPVSSAYQVEGRNLRLARTGGGELALQFDFHNGTGDRLSLDSFGIDSREQLLALVDLPRGTAYGPIGGSGPDGRVAAASEEEIEPDGSVMVTAVFTAPPKEATKMLVAIDGLLPVVVPIKDEGLTDVPVLHGSPGKPQVGPLVCKAQAGGREEFKLPSDVLFEFGSSKLSPAAKSALSGLRDRITAGSGTVTVDGHTDAVGDKPANQRLSEERAAAVDRALSSDLGDDFDYAAKGHGEIKPIAPNTLPDGTDNPDGRAQNRRVEVHVDSGTTLQSRATDTVLSDAGLRAQAGSVQRLSGYALATVKVTNPGQDTVPLDFDNHFTPKELTTGQLSLAGQSTRYDVCGFAEPTYFDFIGNLSQRFAPGKLSVIPAGAEVTLWSLFPAPDAGAVEVELAGYADRLPAEITS
ncbi:OmpA family protein [Nonomuraea sp. NPDC026600]|uniref:OmpA family protein n=1 Tax=Nonomuraea sp. NPDC026600 TaxID=3155363 RepID=UPI0033E82C94